MLYGSSSNLLLNVAYVLLIYKFTDMALYFVASQLLPALLLHRFTSPQFWISLWITMKSTLVSRSL